MKKSKYSNYQICVMIIEARHLQQLANPMVVVKLGNQKRRTVVREGTDCPVYNEYFVFDFVGNFETLLSTRITIAVYLRNYLRQLKFYGSSIFEVEAVWEQPDHQYHHKWAMLTDPKSLSTDPKGYVKCNVAVRAKGAKVRVYADTEGEDDIEGLG
ncbi:otoferlin-like [Polistes fuscatus]|uniref:otoferlin-like n=1 Tax=Polistes fuscatus TaxID=30207 RepID=UPI001CA9F21B|nr:otoferlin-like [Polistes fuscatus]